jgi:hypothetical protein
MARSDLQSLLVLALALVLSVMVAGSMPHGKIRKRGAELPAPRISITPQGQVSISAPGEVRYTLDGSLPTISSPRYHGPFTPDTRLTTARSVAIPTSVQWRHPAGTQPHGSVIRAGVIDGKGHVGALATASVLPMVHGDLPVLSLTLPAGALFDPDTGIYVVGHAIFHTDQDFVRRFPEDQKWWKYPGNFHYRGERAERTGHLAYFDPRSQPGSVPLWEAAMKLRINGNNTRGFPQHALRVVFDAPLEQNVFGISANSGYERLILRSSGNDQDRTFFRDALQHRLCRDLPFETAAAVQSVLYVNGAYWGLHNIRERLDQEEIGRRYRLRPKDITILADRLELYEGDEREVHRFARLLTWSERWDATAPAFMDSLEQRMDVDGFLTYMAAQIILGNTDWPDQNGKWWRFTGRPDTTASHADGRWYFIMGDSDLSFGMTTGPEVDMFKHIDGHAAAPFSRLFKACLRNDTLRHRFRKIMVELLKGALSAERMTEEAGTMRQAIVEEMPRHIDRWRRPVSMEKWRAHVDVLLTFARERGRYVRAQLDEHVPLVPLRR